MGEAAEAVTDGAVCEWCGIWFDDVLEGADPPGHPRRCEQCEPPKRRRSVKPQSRAREQYETAWRIKEGLR